MMNLKTTFHKNQSGRAQPHSRTLTRVSRRSVIPTGPGVRQCCAAFALCILLFCAIPESLGADTSEIGITKGIDVFGQKPIPVSISGFSGEALDALKFDLYVQGFSFVGSEATPQYLINGSNNGNVQGR